MYFGLNCRVHSTQLTYRYALQTEEHSDAVEVKESKEMKK